MSIQISRNCDDPNRSAIARTVCDSCGYIINERPAGPGEHPGTTLCVCNYCGPCAAIRRTEQAAYHNTLEEQQKQLKQTSELQHNLNLLNKLKGIHVRSVP